jgi:hypothetical protein
MIALGSTELARLNSNVRGVAWMVDLAFTTGMQRFTTAALDITDGDGTYTALGTLGSISQVSESENTGHDRLTMSLSVANSALLALGLGNVSSYRNRRATIYLVLFDENFQVVGTKITRWIGMMDRVNIRRQGAGGSIDLECVRSGMPKVRNREGLKLSFAQQMAKYPGDTGLRYITKLVKEPSVWLSKEFQGV